MSQAPEELSAIVVPAFNRTIELCALLQSIVNAQRLTGVHIPIIVSVDGGNPDVVATAEAFSADGVIVRTRTRMGLRQHILDCGDLCEEYGSIMVLEDDLILSPAAFGYVRSVLDYAKQCSEIGAISLYSFQNNDFAPQENMRSECRGDVFLAKTGSSWGQVWWRSKWREFRKWLQHEYDKTKYYRVPQRVQGWPETSWKKLFNYWLADTNTYSIVPLQSVALCTGGRTGTNSAGIVGTYFSRVRTIPAPVLIPSPDVIMRLDPFLELETDGLDLSIKAGSPLAKIEFDLTGTKTRRDLTKPLILTRRQHSAKKTLGTVDTRLGNPLLGLVHGFEGPGLWLVNANDFDDAAPLFICHTERRLHMAWASTTELIALAGESLKHGAIARFRK